MIQRNKPDLLTAGNNGRQKISGLPRGQNHKGTIGRLLEYFEQGIARFGVHRVRIGDDDNALTLFMGFHGQALDEVPDNGDANQVTRRLQVQDIRVIVRLDASACTATATRIRFGGRSGFLLRERRTILRIGTVAGHGKGPGRRLFADTVNTGKKERVGNLALPDQGGQELDSQRLALYQIKTVHRTGIRSGISCRACYRPAHAILYRI